MQDAPGAAAMVNGVPSAWLRWIRLERAAVITLHVALVAGLRLSPWTYLLLYALAGVSWSAQRYVTQAIPVANGYAPAGERARGQ